MKPLDKNTAAKLARLGAALDARTSSAAQTYRKAMELIDNLTANITALRVTVASAAGDLDPTDLASFAAYEPWANAQRQKIKDLLNARLGAEARADVIREELSRAHGEEKAVAWLLDEAKKARRREAMAAAR